MDKNGVGTMEILNNKGKYDRIIDCLFIFLFFITPLSRAGINIITPLLTIVWVAKKLKFRDCPDEKLKYPELHRWVAILGVAVLLSFINPVNFAAALKNFADEYILFALIFIISLDVIKNQEQLKRLFGAAISSSLIVAVWGLYERFGKGYARINSTITGANEAGTYFVSMALLGLSFLLFSNKQKSSKFIASSLFTLLNLSCVFYTGSRGAWLSLFAGFVVLLFLAIKNNKPVSFKKVIVVLVIIILTATFVDLGWVVSRLDSITDLSDSSNRQRIMMATTGLQMLKDHPLFGVGIGQFLHVYPDYKLETANVYTHIHCFYLHLAVEIGLIGFLVFLILVFKVLKTGLQAFFQAEPEQWFYYGVIGALVGFGVHNLFEWSFLNLQVGAFTLILVAIWLNKTNIVEG
ncbi:MAG TPA: hypothetical protein DEB05_02090 [Firmicutes bacterium]|nr:hypothetical protein [Bacillota bacterium]